MFARVCVCAPGSLQTFFASSFIFDLFLAAAVAVVYPDIPYVSGDIPVLSIPPLFSCGRPPCKPCVNPCTETFNALASGKGRTATHLGSRPDCSYIPSCYPSPHHPNCPNPPHATQHPMPPQTTQHCTPPDATPIPTPYLLQAGHWKENCSASEARLAPSVPLPDIMATTGAERASPAEGEREGGGGGGCGLVIDDESVEVGSEIAEALEESGEEALRTIQRVVAVFGEEAARMLLVQTWQVEEQGGLLTLDGSQRCHLHQPPSIHRPRPSLLSVYSPHILTALSAAHSSQPHSIPPHRSLPDSIQPDSIQPHRIQPHHSHPLRIHPLRIHPAASSLTASSPSASCP